jgi:CheY-like chemotaxis protein
VLVVDDHEAARYIVRQCLPSPRYIVTEAATGESALALARSTTPDAVILDLNLPDMHGRDVLAQLRQNPETAAVPIIIVSSQALSERDRAGWAAQADGIVAKHQLTRQVLEESLSGLLTRGERTRA